MRLDLLFVLLFLFLKIPSFGQNKNHLKAWYGENLEYIKIDSQHVYFEINGRHDHPKRYHLIGDTLRLYEKYTTSRDNYRIQHIDKFDFIIKMLNEDKMLLKPIDSNAKNLVNQRKSLKVVGRENLKISNIKFEQLKFKFESYMYGFSSLSVNSKRHFKFIYSNAENIATYQQGELAIKDYEELIKLLNSSEIEKLKNYDTFSTHSDEYTLQFDYDNKSKVIKQFSLPSVTNELIAFLHKIPKMVVLENTEAFEINFGKPRSN